MIVNLVAGALVAALGSVIAILAIVVARVQDRARHRIPRPHPLAILARDLLGLLPPAPAPATWAVIRAGMDRPPRYVDTSRTLAETFGPIVTDDEVAEEWSLRPLSREGIREQWERVPPPSSHPYPPLRPTVLERPDGHILIDEGERIHVRPAAPAVPPPVVHDTLYDLPVVPRYARDVVYGEACELDVAEAERQFALALGPDGCEEVR